jgi:uncharacterized protein (TIGR03435 family)
MQLLASQPWAPTANGGSLADRIARLLRQWRWTSRTMPGAGATSSGILIAVAACGVFGQSADLPRFAVASVKPDPPSALRHTLLPPVGGRLSTRLAPLRLLIEGAYGVQSFQIYGGPDWMNSAGYAIEAKAEGDPTQSQIWLMLQSVLLDRFRLKVHRETKVLPLYALTAAKSGLKLPKPTEGGCIETAPVKGQRPPDPCGYATVAFEPAKGLEVEGRQLSMADLIKQLSAILQRPIVDQTGFLGKFDVNLRFAYDQEVTVGIGNPWLQSNPGQPGDPEGSPSIMTALQQQLGVKLESTKGPVEILVIDRAERPTEN